MEKSIEIYNISNCPSCGKAHKYTVAVLRSNVLFGASDTDAPSEKRIRRIFICPEKKIKFEGVIILPDDPTNKIASVTVEGLIEEKK